MSYLEHGTQATQYIRSFLSYVHQRAFPLCADFTLKMGRQWPPFQTALDVVGPMVFTIVLEALLLYVGARIAISAFKIVSSTLYRILRLALLVLFIGLGISLGLYVYLTDASNSKAVADMTKNHFWLNQVASFASLVTPMWNDILAQGKADQKRTSRTHTQHDQKAFKYKVQQAYV
ncbi:hypothetical protein H4S06_003289 [Coemansia sp. BCRC 34490]|nr:hypothetical protein LPJ72_002998 [Coemansia sp. Benny D160-2]KAJ2756496.1 hypothetical protein H4S06_003289 [Coemansia sp. BCRC 34490]